MLSKQEVERLKESIKQGEEAKAFINKYENLEYKVEWMKNKIEETNKITEIQLDKSKGEYVVFEIKDSTFASKLIKEILMRELQIKEHELKMLCNK